MTTEELLALPDDGVERWLIRGRLRQRAGAWRDRWHGKVEARIAGLLDRWLEQQPEPRGALYSGGADFRPRREPDTIVGIDMAYVSPEAASRQPEDTTLVDGVPTLAVEILSPSTTAEEIDEKVGEYLAAGVPLTWVVNTRFRTVTVYRPGAEPEMVNVAGELSGEPHLPGFRVPAARLFER